MGCPFTLAELAELYDEFDGLEALMSSERGMLGMERQAHYQSAMDWCAMWLGLSL